MTPAQKLLILPLAAALLAGCGSNDLPDAQAPALAASAPPALAVDSPLVPPLLADDGSVLPSAPQNEPADPGAHTRAGRYASRAQADLLAQALGENVVRIALTGSGSEAVSIGLTEVGMQIDAKLLPDYTPMLIEATDLRTGAAMIEQLATQGFKNTWLVTR
ncbi:MAG TPA: hypothetical protein VFK82_06355 [Burkholderiaceae bacterium]|nr:hypothetical protein [Burkholderiaceae bacterium]